MKFKKIMYVSLLLNSMGTNIVGLELEKSIAKTHQEEVLHPESYRRIIIITDEDPQDEVGSNLLVLISALTSQTSPVFITTQLLIDFLDIKLNLIKKYHVDHPEYFNTLEKVKNIYQKSNHIPSQESIAAIVDAAGMNPREIQNFFVYQISLNNDDWYIFATQETDHLLLIPVKYLINKIGKAQLTFTPEEDAAIGFKLSTLKQLFFPKTKSLKSYPPVEAFHNELCATLHEQTYQKNELTAPLKKIFAPTSYNETTQEYAYSWNIFITGHGTVDYSLTVGLTPKHFQQYLNFFNHTIHTNLLYYVTCYGGSETALTKPYTSFTGLANVTYTIVSGATTNATVQHNLATEKDLTIFNTMLLPRQYLAEFFSALEHQKPLESALEFVTNFSIASKTAPLVRFRGTEWFSPIRVAGKVTYITTTNNFAHTIDTKPFLIPPTQKVLFIYPKIVTVPIRLFPNGIQIIFRSDTFIHYIEAIEIEDLESFIIPGLIEQETTFARRMFIFIKKLSILPSAETLLLRIIDNDTEQDITHQFIHNNVFTLTDALILLPKTLKDNSELKIGYYDEHVEKYCTLLRDNNNVWRQFKTIDTNLKAEYRNIIPKLKKQRNEIIQQATEMRSTLGKKKYFKNENPSKPLPILKD